MASAFRDRMLAATRVAYDQQRALQEEISQLYVQCAENLGRVADRYGDDSLTGRQAIVLRKSMQRYTRQMWSEVESKTRAGAAASASIGIEAQASMLDDALHGIGITGKPSFMSVFGRTKDEAVASVLNGHIYAGKRAGLSKRIWNNEAMLNGQLESIISTAVAEGRSATQLARDLEAYVNPEAMMPDHWNDIYPMPFSYAVDYNAKRLAVTTLNHAYYQGTIMAARENPFAEFLHWELSSFHLIYDVCDTYMEHDEGLGLGNFSLDNAPLPHPFCRCTWYIDSSKSLDEIGQELGDWLAGAENPKLEKAFGEWKERTGLAFSTERDTIKLTDILIQHSIGARNANEFPILSPDGEENIHIADGEYIRNVKVFAGKGTSVRIRESESLEEYYGVPASEWQKVKGFANVEYDGEIHLAEIHWYQAEGIGRIEAKLKQRPDGGWWLDDR